MGQIYKPNLALTTDLILGLLKMLENHVREAMEITNQFDRIVFGTFLVLSHVLSLRGSEGTMLNLSAVVKHRETAKDWIVLGLKGKIKGESNERDHIFYCVNETSSGIKVRSWLDLLISVHSKAGRNGGPGITD